MPRDGKGITIYFEGNTVQFDRSVDGMKKALVVLKAQTKAFKDEFRKTGDLNALKKQINSLAHEQKAASVAAKLWADEVARLAEKGSKRTEEEEKEYKNAIKNYNRARSQLVNIQTNLTKNLQTLKDSSIETDKFAEAMETAGDAIKDAGSKISSLGGSLQPISSKAVGLLKDAANYAIEFEDAAADVRKTVEETDTTSYEDIENSLREMAKELPVSAADLAHIAGLAGQMGVGADDVAMFTRKMVEFGYSTNITSEQAAQDIAQIYNVVGKGGDFSSLDNLLSSIVRLGNTTATTEADIVEMYRNIASASTRVGMSEPQIAALAATLSSLGLDKGGASSVSTILTQISMAVDSGGKALQKYADASHMSAEEFASAWRDDAAGAFTMLLEGLKQTVDEGGSLNEEFQELGIKEIRRVDTMGRLVNATNVYNDAMKDSLEAYELGADLENEAAKRLATLKSRLAILKNNFIEFATVIGESLYPYIELLVQKIGEFADWLNKLTPAQKDLIAQLLVLVAVLAPTLKFVGSLTSAIGIITQNLPILKTLLGSMANVVKMLATNIAGVVKAVGGFIAANPVLVIAALAAAVIWLWQNCKPFKDFITNLLSKVSELWNKFKEIDWIQTLGDKLGILGTIFGAILETITAIIEAIGKLVKKVAESDFGQLIGKIGGFIGRGIGGLFSSGGYSSGGMMSNSITMNNTFTISGNVDRNTVLAWADVLTERINENLGRMV